MLSHIHFGVCLWTKVSFRIVAYTVNDVTASKENMYLDIPVAAFFLGVPH